MLSRFPQMARFPSKNLQRDSGPTHHTWVPKEPEMKPSKLLSRWCASVPIALFAIWLLTNAAARIGSGSPAFQTPAARRNHSSLRPPTGLGYGLPLPPRSEGRCRHRQTVQAHSLDLPQLPRSQHQHATPPLILARKVLAGHARQFRLLLLRFFGDYLGSQPSA